MTRLLTDARLALILLAWLVVVQAFTWPSLRCAWFHQVVIDGRVYEGPCAPAGRPGVALVLMAPAPLAAVAAMVRPGGSLKRSLSLVALVALELALIFDSYPGRVLRYPELLRPASSGGEWTVIVNPRPITQVHVDSPPGQMRIPLLRW
jgi:hypothetical protein